MLAEDQILDAFKKCFEADKDQFVKSWIVRWRYVDVVQNKQEFYQLDRLYSFEGKKELTDWLDYCTWHPKTNYFPKGEVNELIESSLKKDQEIFANLGLEFKWSKEDYYKYIGIINAEDHMLQNFYPVPEAKKSNMRHRPVGLGVQGLADVFFKMKLPYTSPEAQEINENIFETILHRVEVF